MPDHTPSYEEIVLDELHFWQKSMQQKPSLLNQAAKGMQTRFNRIIPEKVHQFISTVIKQMTRGVLTGSRFTTPKFKTLH